MTTITESQWVDYFGFQRFPFDRPEAGNEEFARPDFLASCFVEPRGFERVFGQVDSPVTSLLFAARGTGKTACRVMMDYYCQNRLTPLNAPKSGESNYVLSVPHVRLDNVRYIARHLTPNNTTQEISLEHHVIEIMRQAVRVFVDTIAKNTELTNNFRNLSKANFDDLGQLIKFYCNYLSSSQKEFLSDLGFNVPPLDDLSISFVGHISVPPLNYLEQWANLMILGGIRSTYILVDGVDELTESASNPNYAYHLIKPLLTNLRPMDGTHHLAFKFFLPSDIEQAMLSDRAFRKDRGFIVQNLEWKSDDLIKILRKRLSVLRRLDYEIRDDTADSFDALCVPEIRGEIEQNIVDIIKGNPRQLMNFCSLMVSVHCSRDIQGQDDPYQLSKQDFEMAQQVFDVEPVYQNETSANPKPDISLLIAQGEGENVEFKSSIRYDYKRQAVNKDDLGLAITKTLAGFMNRDGGILVIGVNDDGEVLGIEKDFEGLVKKNVDGFQLALRDLIKFHLGTEYLIYLHLHFETLNDHMICAVHVERSLVPVYVKNGNDKEFYVRGLNSTDKLSLPETVNYIRSRWG